MSGRVIPLGRGHDDQPERRHVAEPGVGAGVPKTVHPTASADVQGSPTSVTELSRLVMDRRAELEARAFRILGDSHEAADVVQEAFLKVVLAAPELASTEQVVAYLRTTVTNLALNTLRAAGRRPSLVAISPDDPADFPERFEALAAFDADLQGTLERAYDATLVRDALSRLTPSHRQALLLFDAHGASTDEVAEALGIKPSAVRSVVYRARAALRHTLESTVVDAERGLTAADLLNTSIARAARAGKAAGKVALAFMLPLLAGIAWWFGPPSSRSADVSLPSPAAPSDGAPAPLMSSGTPTTSSPGTGWTSPRLSASAQAQYPGPLASATPNPRMSREAVLAELDASLTQGMKALTATSSELESILANAGGVQWPGIGSDGLPGVFAISDGRTSVSLDVVNHSSRISLSGRIVTDMDLVALELPVPIVISQRLVWHGERLRVEAIPSVLVENRWVEVPMRVTHREITQIDAGQTEILLWLVTQPAPQSDAHTSMPELIGLRILTTPIGQPIFATSVVVVDLDGVAR